MIKLFVMNPGEMRHPVALLTPIRGMGVSGANVTYSPMVTLKAKVEDTRGDDRIKSGQDSGRLAVTVTVHYFPGMNSAMRVQLLETNEILEILAIKDPDRTKRYMQIVCLEVGAQAVVSV